MNPALKESLRQQRANLFGRGRYWFHIIIWLLAFVLLGIAIAEVFNGIKSGLKIDIDGVSEKNLARVIKDKRLMAAFLTISGLMAALIVYLLLLFVIPYARYRKRKRVLWIGIITAGVVWLGFLLLLALWIGSYYHATELKDRVIVVVIIMGLSATLSFSIASYFYSLYYFIDLYDQQAYLNKYQKVFTLRLHAETNFLQTQINPHFLFNTLNNIYSLTLKQSPDAPVITRRLKELISYMLEDFSRDTVSLEEEISFLQNYVELEQLRNKEGQADIRFEVHGDISGKQIAPLLLVNFIENAFKHGVKAGIDHSYVYIRLDIEGDKLVLDLKNSRQKQDKHNSIVYKGGIGIRNVKRRLELLYPGCHRLRIRKSGQEFRIHLQIKLQP